MYWSFFFFGNFEPVLKPDYLKRQSSQHQFLTHVQPDLHGYDIAYKKPNSCRCISLSCVPRYSHFLYDSDVHSSGIHVRTYRCTSRGQLHQPVPRLCLPRVRRTDDTRFVVNVPQRKCILCIPWLISCCYSVIILDRSLGSQ